MEKREKNFIIALLLVIIFLIILFFLISHFGRIEVKIPTGYVDIFDINFIGGENNNCKCCNCETGTCNKNNCPCNKETDNLSCSGNCKNTSTSKKTGMLVYDEEKQYAEETPLNIFKHKSYYTVDGVIAPGSENAYQFIIRNNNKFAIIYDLKMIETNNYNINMKYRLKLNGKYIMGDEKKWISAQELMCNEVVLANNSYNVYTLEWKWFESENDTEIGTNVEANYQINIELFASEY